LASRLHLRPTAPASTQWLRPAPTSASRGYGFARLQLGFDRLQRRLRVATASSGSSSSVPKATASRGKGFARLQLFGS